VRRRELIALLGGAAVASSVSWPLATRAQQAMLVYDRREYAAAGGLVSYGTSYPAA